MITESKRDKSHKKLQVQQYLRASVNWLAEHPGAEPAERINESLLHHVNACLGRKSPEKESLVRVMIAHLTYDNQSMKKLRGLIANKKMINRIEQIDVFSNDFQKQIDRLLLTIGQAASGGHQGTSCQYADEQYIRVS
jgi:hypothetical protein